MWSEISRVARRELAALFASPAALLFVGAFLAVVLFVFFWVETFFARNIADARPLFQWMPVLLIFLAAALTMRLWSEERRAGTIELLMTAPVRPLSLVLGKFLAAMGLITVAVALTVPIPVTVSLLGPLDWGPVVGGYLATLFLAAAYVSVGLYVSARTDNAIVALIVTVLVCGLLYLIGAEPVTALAGYRVGGWLKLIGTGARFESITRGVLDLRDIYYYLSLVGVFLSLNVLALEQGRWVGNRPRPRHRQWRTVVALAVVNFLVANVWLANVRGARIDITEGHLYTLSPATRTYLGQLREPLLIRGYFSARTHPLLAPLVPQLEDLLAEYAVAGGDRVRVEFVDPHDDPEIEQEAASRYGIRPVPFQSASKYQASVVNSYFNILVAYGDQYQVLDYHDVVEVKLRNERDIEVDLKNPEYAVTRAIKRVLTAYQGGGSVFDALPRPVRFTGYMSSPERLPKKLAELRATLEELLGQMKDRAGGKLEVRFVDPDADGGKVATEIRKRFGFRPQVTSLLDENPFWFYMVLESGDEAVQVPLPDPLDRDGLERAIEAGLKRFSPGFLKTVGLVAARSPRIPGMPRGRRYETLREMLSQTLRVRDVDLSSGRVPEDVDLLTVLAPQGLDDKGRFAIDQFLMQGGTVVLATSPFEVQVGERLTARKVDSGLEPLLARYGVTVAPQMVLDPHNTAMPIPIDRDVGGFTVREIHMLDYPYFVDVRGDGLASHPITAELGQITLNWVSPVTVKTPDDGRREAVTLLRSSPASWTSDDTDVVPDFRRYPALGFDPAHERGRQPLAVLVEGEFDSLFAGKPSPLATGGKGEGDAAGKGKEGADGKEAKSADDQAAKAAVTGVIEHSPDSARLIVIGSNEFATDDSLDLAAEAMGTRYTRPVDFLQNAVEWALEDQGLLAIRSRAHFARTLAPLDRRQQLFWEYLNYGLAALGMLGVWGWRRYRQRAAERRYRMLIEGARA